MICKTLEKDHRVLNTMSIFSFSRVYILTILSIIFLLIDFEQSLIL